MKWIKTWAKLKDNQTYLVMARHPPRHDGTELLYQPQILLGWQTKRLIEGCYVTTEFDAPKTIEECE